jgi:predicted RNA-binding Zn-ribbon protein involved in translation (DUF1610 family)
MKQVKNLKDRRMDLPGHSVRDWENERKKNLKDGYWACVCGSRKFHLLQHARNVKAICPKCGDTEIIYWNEAGDTAAGAMRRLDSGKWVHIKTRLVLE